MHSNSAAPSISVEDQAAPRASSSTYRLDARRSLVRFSVRHLTGRVHGTFMRATGTVTYDPKRPEATAVRVTIQAGSVMTHNPARDSRLRSHGFLDARKYPAISFVAGSAQRAGRKLEVTGELTMRGVTCPVTVTVGRVRAGGGRDQRTEELNAVARAVLRRSDFGVGPSGALEGGVLIGDEIAVDIDVELVRC